MNLGRLTDEYMKLKENHPGEILLFQVGVFYKIMHEDAKKVAGPLGLKLFVTGEAAAPVPVCGFPKSGLDKYMGKLLRAGFAVAVGNQTPAENGGVTRQVTEVLKCGVEPGGPPYRAPSGMEVETDAR